MYRVVYFMLYFLLLFALSTTVVDNKDTNSQETKITEKNGTSLKQKDNSTSSDEKDYTINNSKYPEIKSDNARVVDDISVLNVKQDDTTTTIHSVRLLLYVAAPISALVLIYFLMKGIRKHSRSLLSQYQMISPRSCEDSIELHPLDDDDDDDVVFERKPMNIS